MKKFLVLFSISISLNLYAGCLDGLRDVLKDNFIGKDLLDNIERVYDHRQNKLKEELDEAIGNTFSPSGAALRLREYLEKVETNTDRRMLIELIPSIYMNSGLIKEWARDLVLDVVRDLVKRNNLSEIQKIAWEGIIKEELMLRVLSKRLKEAGFKDPNFIEAERVLEVDVFGDILQNGDLIIDRFFQQDSHGALIHIWQLDLIRFAAKKRNINPKAVEELYSWMGENKIEALPSGGQFVPLEHVWDLLFDPITGGLTCPEVLNPIIAEYFGK